MARSIAQALNLIPSIARARPSSTHRRAILLLSPRHESTQPDRRVASTSSDTTSSEAEAVAVQRIEDAIHRIIVRRSAPDWLPFLPGASYWVPPRRSSYGIADLVSKLSNSLSDEEIMSLATFRGWPSLAFYLNETGRMSKNAVIQCKDEEEKTGSAIE